VPSEKKLRKLDSQKLPARSQGVLGIEPVENRKGGQFRERYYGDKAGHLEARAKKTRAIHGWEEMSGTFWARGGNGGELESHETTERRGLETTCWKTLSLRDIPSYGKRLQRPARDS